MLPQLGGGIMILVGMVLFMFGGQPVLKMLGAAMVIGASLGVAYTSIGD